MPKVFTSKTQKIGELGEDLAVKFLAKEGFSIIERNYTRRFGEIDIIAKNKNVLHFIEVKSVSCETLDTYVTHETKRIRPEENMTPKKIEKMARTLQNYLLENGTRETEWQIDLLCVFIDMDQKKARVQPYWNIII